MHFFRGHIMIWFADMTAFWFVCFCFVVFFCTNYAAFCTQLKWDACSTWAWAGQFLIHSRCSLDGGNQAVLCTKKINSYLSHCTAFGLHCYGLCKSGKTVSGEWKQKCNLSRSESQRRMLPWKPIFAMYWEVAAAFPLKWRHCHCPAWVQGEMQA